MTGQFKFKNLEHLIEIIKKLKEVGSSIDYKPILNISSRYVSSIFDEILFKNNDLSLVKYILKDMNNQGENYIELLIYMMGKDLIKKKIAKLVVNYCFKYARQEIYEYFQVDFYPEFYPLYMKTRNKHLLNNILTKYNLKYLYNHDGHYFDDEFVDILVVHIDRDRYIEKMSERITPNMLKDSREWRIEHNKLVTKIYDDAVKRRVIDISAGFGYQGIPNLVLDAIIGETVDTSGMTAYKVDKIIGKFNLWKTDTTMRIGENEDIYQSAFKDAQE
jgi:hypothetical protein